jgi:bacteriocin biosynthesis cyclodehydratase domain-containing protein
MIQRPQFKAHFHVETVRDEGVFLISEVGHSVLNGRLFELVAGLVNGRRSADEIAEALRDKFSAAEVYYALILLEQKGYLAESDRSFKRGEAAFWTIQGIEPQRAARCLAETPVSVKSFGKVSLKPFLKLLKSQRVRVEEEGVLGVVLTDDYLRGDLQAYNQEALSSGRAWMLLKPVGSQILLGPLFRPGQTGCWACLAQRLRINRSVEMFVQQQQQRHEPFPIPNAATAATEQIAYGIAATEIAKWIALGKSPTLEGRVLSLDGFTWQTQSHMLIRQPHCPACGDAPSAMEEPMAAAVVLESRKKSFVEDGGHRVVSPEKTLQKYERHVSPVTGAVQGLRRYFVADDGIMHVYVAGENFAAPHHNLKHLQWTLRSRSSGKGISDLQAKASGLCEALERYSGVFQGTELRRQARLGDLEGLGIHPNDCMLFSEQQYSERKEINGRGSRFYYVPLPFEEEAEIEWTPVWSLTHKVHRYLPTEYCYYAYPSPERQKFSASCSNGSAAGNTLEEAILQGFLELVERDSTALWWYNRLRRPAVDLESFDEPYLGKLRAFLKGRQRDLWALDLTSDLGIPVFAALSRRIDQPQEQVMIGFGAHLDARLALLRAVTELNQMLVWVLHDENLTDGIEDSDILTWLRTGTTANQPYLAPDDSARPTTSSTYAQNWTDDLKDDVLLCQSLVERHGMEMLVLDQTRPDIGLPVAKVFVPGLRHFWARYAPGRLYEIPAALGWLNQPLTEDQLNPVPMFL